MRINAVYPLKRMDNNNILSGTCKHAHKDTPRQMVKKTTKYFITKDLIVNNYQLQYSPLSIATKNQHRAL